MDVSSDTAKDFKRFVFFMVKLKCNGNLKTRFSYMRSVHARFFIKGDSFLSYILVGRNKYLSLQHDDCITSHRCHSECLHGIRIQDMLEAFMWEATER